MSHPSKAPGSSRPPSRGAGKAGKTVRLRPANPFDLIRLLAHSQSDSRKALAELVQNSLDAGARHVTVTRWRGRGDVLISVLDDGQGVFPELERPEALERIATHIGHSFKRNLSPAERQQQMMLGKYGIGILGFWSLGQELEMRTRVSGSDVWALRLIRDEPMAEVLRVPESRLKFPGETWTEIVIRGVHNSPSRQIAGRRLGDYLGSELRGQLLERQVELRIVDRLARGAAPKNFVVVPPRFRGRRIQDIFQISVLGHAPARAELYYVDPEANREHPSAVALTCGGSVVCDDLAHLEGYDFGRPPWSCGCFEGFVEFPELEVPPATRRGLVPGPVAEALFTALRLLEPDLLAVLEKERENRRAEADESLAREIRKVFRPVAKALPQYDFFEVRAKSTEAGSPEEERGTRLGRMDGVGPAAQEPAEPVTSETVEEGDEPEAEPEILPPGPLARVRIVPRKSRLLPGATRTLTAKAVDELGKRILEGIDFTWELRDGGGTLVGAKDRATYTAPETIGTARIFVQAREWKRAAEADAVLEIVEQLSGNRSDAGIPEPKRAYDPAGDWRSRVRGRCWEYNAAHRDYQSVVDDPKRRFRYLVHLFAKEMVLRNYGEAKDERLLERVVEVLTHIQTK